MSAPVMPRWGFIATPALLAGLIWLSVLFDEGLWGWLTGGLPALLITMSAGGWILMPGDRHYLHFMSIGALLGIFGAVLGMPAWGFLAGLGLAGLSLLVAVVAGWIGVTYRALPDTAPKAELNPILALKEALDNAVVGLFISVPKVIHGEAESSRVAAELDAALETFKKNGWDKNPDALIETPPVLDNPQIKKCKLGGHQVETLRFESGYQPHPELPGGERWMSYAPNRDARAMVLRHDDDKTRPWVICIHGYQMGMPWLDLKLFEPKFLHEKLGCNVILPLLPLHGGRKIRMLSGDGYLNGDVMDSFNAIRQSQWDIRRVMSWARTQGAEQIGAIGYSLGGYNASLLSTIEDLDMVIAAVPLTDISSIFWEHGPRHILDDMVGRNVTVERGAELMAPLSPLSRPCLVPVEKRHIIAGVADEIIPPHHVNKLEQVWVGTESTWYQGSHLVFKDQACVDQAIADKIKECFKPIE